MQAAVTKKCRGCGRPLSIVQTVRGLCERADCRRKDVAYQTALRRAATLASVRASLPANWPADRQIALLPRNSQQLVPLANDRISRLRLHLEQITIEAGSCAADALNIETQASSNGIKPELTALSPLDAACGLCGGHCCHTGGDTAWLEAATIRRLGWQSLGLSDARIVAYYLSFLPASSYENSCIYHAEYGCRLPRKIRSNVCNQYLCRGLAELVSGLSAKPGTCVAATLNGNTVAEIALLDAAGILEKQSTQHPAG